MSNLRCAAAIAMVFLAGCVSAYDPAVPGRLGLATRAEEVGTVEERPAAPRKPWFWRWRKLAAGNKATTQPATKQPEPQPTTTATTPPPAPKPAEVAVQPTLAEPGVTVPDTPVGRQLAWWISVLRGGSTRDLESHFNPEFLKKVPASQVRAIARQWRHDEMADGPVEIVRIEPGATPERLTAMVRGKNTDRYTQLKMGVDGNGQLIALWLGPVVGVKQGDITSWAKLDDKFKQQPGQISFAAAELLPSGELREIHTFGGDNRLAVGSAFKLFVLGALADQVAAGKAAWNEPLKIQDDLKSLPTGQMQLETEGMEFPISRFADLMISVSDNTAADHLLARLGRDTVEAYFKHFSGEPAKTLPFLSTMEMFRIKLGPDRTLPDRYAAADEATRRQMLAPGGDVAKSSPSFAGIAMWKAPFHIQDIEWFATAPEMVRLMTELHKVGQQPDTEPVAHALRINPGLQFDPKTWKTVEYKGGSEPGVLNMTWMLERTDGRWFALSFGWNDPHKEVDLKVGADMVGAAVGLLADEK